MALSEKEQQLLAQMEAALAAEDPKLAHTLSGREAKRIHGRRATLAGLGILAGLALLVAGMSTSWWVSVVGFVVMLVSTVALSTAWVSPSDARKPSGRPSASGGDFMTRFEQRWRRRQEGDN